MNTSADSYSEKPGIRQVRVLSRGLTVLWAFEPNNDWLSNSEIAALTGLPKPTVSRLTANLLEAEYLQYSAQRAAYRLGAAVLALGFIAASHRDFVMLARPLMQQFADQHQVSVVLASPDASSMVCNEVAHSRDMIFTLRVRAGSRLRIDRSALGRALVGAMGDAERTAFLEKLGTADPQAWELLSREVPTAISQMASDGYCIAAGTLEAGTNGAAVVVDTPEGPHTYALGCAAPSNSLELPRLKQEVIPDLLALKNRLEAELSNMQAE